MTRNLAPASGRVARTACARVLLLPAQAWMALRRLGWAAAPQDGVTVNDRIVRMAQELAGRTLRSACWRDGLTRAITANWPADPSKRTPEEWDAVRAAAPGGEHLPSAVIRARTRQAARCLHDDGRLPADVTGLEEPPHVPAMLILAACDRQQAVLERHDADPRRALLRLQLPVRPDPRGYGDWSWVAVPLALPPTVPQPQCCTCPPCGPLAAECWPTSRSPSRFRRPGEPGTPSPWVWTGA